MPLLKESPQGGSGDYVEYDAWSKRLIQLEKDHTKLDLRVDSAVADIAALKSDIRVIVDWVEVQKRKSLSAVP